MDPLTWDYPELTNYQYASNEPIANVDMDGLELLNALKRPLFEVGFKDAAGIALPGVGTLLNLGVNVAKLGAGQAAKTVGTRFADMLIEDALMGGPRLVGGGGGALLTILLLSPDYDSWNRKDHREFPDSYYENLRKFKSPTPPKSDNDDDERKHIQYVLIALNSEELDDPNFEYDVMQRGKKEPSGKIKLKKDEVWKYGTTVNPEKRYAQKWLREKKLIMVRQFKGTRSEVLEREKEKIEIYRQIHGKLPPGNKIVR